MKKWLLELWHKILQTYSKGQIELLQEDMKEIVFELNCYKKWYNILLMLWLIQTKPVLNLISETDEEAILEIFVEGRTLQLPLTEYKDILKNVMKAKVSNKTLDITNFKGYQENIDILYKYMLKMVLKDYND